MALANADLSVLGNNATQSVRSDRKYPQSEREWNPYWWNSYWETDLPHMAGMDEFRRYLKKKAFYYKTTDQLPRLKELTKRCASGHQSYGACSVQALRALVRSRGLDSQLDRKSSKRQLVRCLEAADDADDTRNAPRAPPKFHRFFELPAELRNRVYTFYFESLGKVPPRFVVPPLCRASHQLRSETTGLFFEHSIFTILLRPVYFTRGHEQPFRHRAQLHYHTEVARANIPNPGFARIKRLSIEVKTFSNRAPFATWTVDLRAGQCMREWPACDHGFHDESIQSFVDSIMARERLAKLEKTDLDKLEVVVTEACLQL